MKLFLLILTILIPFLTVNTKEYKEKFEGHFPVRTENVLELMALFLPSDPVIFQAYAEEGNTTLQMCERWPDGYIIAFEKHQNSYWKLFERTRTLPNVWAYDFELCPEIDVTKTMLESWCHSNGIYKIDLLMLSLDGYEMKVLQTAPVLLRSVSVIYIDTYLREFNYPLNTFTELKQFLEESGFTLLWHSYIKDLQGKAIFIRTDKQKDL